MELCPQFAAVFLILAAGAAQLAVNTGGDQADEVLRRMPDAKPLLFVHAEWGERMRTASVIAAVSAVVALAFYRFSKFRRFLALITTIAACWACYSVFQAAKHGGAMVYHHGVGVQILPNGQGPAMVPSARRPRRIPGG